MCLLCVIAICVCVCLCFFLCSMGAVSWIKRHEWDASTAMIVPSTPDLCLYSSVNCSWSTALTFFLYDSKRKRLVGLSRSLATSITYKALWFQPLGSWNTVLRNLYEKSRTVCHRHYHHHHHHHHHRLETPPVRRWSIKVNQRMKVRR